MMVKLPSWLIIVVMIALIPAGLLPAAPGSRTPQVTVTLTPTPTYCATGTAVPLELEIFCGSETQGVMRRVTSSSETVLGPES